LSEARAAAAPETAPGIGIDLVDVERFRRILARRPGLAARCFSDAERASLAGRADAVPSLAARFAAKEAVMKALGVGLGAFSWQEVEILSLPSGAPSLRLSGAAADCAAARGIGALSVSLSHTEGLATAVVAAR
jgi:holo-[acyl-carrier protein] synthase